MNFLFTTTILVVILQFTSAQQKCDPASFECSNGYCIPGVWVCDGDNDCGDMSDEKGNSDSCPACPLALHQCKNGRCSNPTFICDDYDDCGDGSDEADENGVCPDCPVAAFVCPNNGKCILPHFICDGFDDCGGWEDETEDACPCADDEFRCSKKLGEEDGPPGDCIPEEWICDEEGIWDCPNGDDEANCTVHGTKALNANRIRETRLSEKLIKRKIAKKATSKSLLSKKRSLYKAKKHINKNSIY